MPTNLKSQTARANGAKSQGPATPEGRAKSSRNSLRHGLSAKSVLLPAESKEEFQTLLDAHIQQFHPSTDVEMDLVEAMAVARWRLRRIWAIETSLLSNELTRRADDIDDEFSELTAEDRVAWVFQKLADNNQSLALLARYEGNLNRAFDRAFKQLNILQQQNEPNPDPPSAPAPNKNALHWPEQQGKGELPCEVLSVTSYSSRPESVLEPSSCNPAKPRKIDWPSRTNPPVCA